MNLAPPPPPQDKPHDLGFLTSSHGMRVGFCKHIAKTPWASMLIVHGFRQHMGWWQHIAQALQQQGVSSYCLDLPHHGHSGGSLGKPADLQVLVDGIHSALSKVRNLQKNQGIPLALLGHSLGSMVALHALQQSTQKQTPLGLQALVLSAPLFGLPREQQWLGYLANLVLGWCLPQFPIPLHSNPQYLTRYKTLYPAYRQDPLRYGFITPRFLSIIQKGAKALLKYPFCGDVPTLLLCPNEERVVNTQKTFAWLRRLPPENQVSVWHCTGRHELFQEQQWQRTVTQLVHWLKTHINKPLLAG